MTLWSRFQAFTVVAPIQTLFGNSVSLSHNAQLKQKRKKKLYNTKYIIKKVIKNNIKGKYNSSDKGSHFPFIKR